MRATLVDAAARVLLEKGAEALTTRQVAARAGTSTMAVYTYFANMEQLRSSLASEGFARLASRMDAAPRPADPVARVAWCGRAYLLNALDNPHLYRFMFVEQEASHDPLIGLSTFQRLADAVQASIAAGRFSHGQPWGLAGQLWAMTHGVIMLHWSGLLGATETATTFRESGINLFIGFGDRRDRAQRSARAGGWMELEEEVRKRPARDDQQPTNS